MVVEDELIVNAAGTVIGEVVHDVEKRVEGILAEGGLRGGPRRAGERARVCCCCGRE